jgi:hypothetical protein
MKKEGGTKVGNFLRGVKGVAPDILNLAGNITGMDVLKNLGNAIKDTDTITPQDKETALQLLKIDMLEMEEVTKRWESDMVSDSWLSKNVRPICLVSLTGFIFFLIITDSKTEWNFQVAESYIKLLETLLVVVYVAYFGSRGVEKYQKIKNN